MTVAKVVHQKIDNSLEFLLEKIAHQAAQDYMGHFTESQFTGLLGQYRLKYPQNPFITHQQVKEICLQHDLKLGTELAFIGDIPEKNQKEIDNFKAPNELWFSYDEIEAFAERFELRNLVEEVKREFNGNIEQDSSNSTTLTLTGSLEEFTPYKFIMPLSKNIALHIDTTKIHEEMYNEDLETLPSSCLTDVVPSCGYKRRVGGVSIVLQTEFMEFFRMEINNESAEVMQVMNRQDDFMATMFGTVSVNVQARLKIDDICRKCREGIETQTNFHQERKVIAPAELFNTTALKEINGYEYALDELALTKPSVFVDDPIILHPVEGGYLVVTKWGGEAELIETNSN